MRLTTIALGCIILISTVATAVLAQHHADSSGARREPRHHAQRARNPPPRALTVPDSGITLPLEDIGGRPTVRVMINGMGPFRFILDTGVTITIVDSALRAELKLPATGAAGAARPARRGAATDRPQGDDAPGRRGDPGRTARRADPDRRPHAGGEGGVVQGRSRREGGTDREHRLRGAEELRGDPGRGEPAHPPGALKTDAARAVDSGGVFGA